MINDISKMDNSIIDEVKQAVSESIEKNKDLYILLEEYDRGECL